MMSLFVALTFFVVNSVEITWVCAGNSYMALDETTIDYSKCDAWIMVGGEPTPLWAGTLPEEECTW